MKASRLALGILSAYFLLGLVHGDEDETAMDTIVVIGERPQAMDYSEIIAASARAASADFDELAIAPPRLEKRPGDPAPKRDALAWAEEGSPLF